MGFRSTNRRSCMRSERHNERQMPSWACSAANNPARQSDTQTATCHVCQDLRAKRLNERARSSQSREFNRLVACPSFEGLEASAQNGCRKCQLLKTAVLFFERPANSETINVLFEDYAEWKITFQSSKGLRQVELFSQQEEKMPLWMLPMAGSERIPGDTGSQASLAWLERMIQRCEQYHKLCMGKKTAAFQLPTRVLDVGSDETTQEMRLCENLNEPGKYICLSHCWGASQIIKTTKATLEGFKRAIPVTELSQTFRDAVTLTRRLGIRYLWIDSLCIIQDSADDWAVESARMASIYKNSFLTIAATRSADGSGGCFSRATPAQRGHEILVEESDRTFKFYVRERLQHFEATAKKTLRNIDYYGSISDRNNATSARTDGPSDETNSSSYLPLLERAWVYQERILSTRMVHFFPGEIVWECAERTACECSRVGGEHEQTSKPKVRHLEVLKSRKIPGMIQYWCHVVEEYSKLCLTFRSDRLPALSGLATEFDYAGRYLAGLWEIGLPHYLLWCVSNPVATKDMSDDGSLRDWQAPSWSWVSIGTHVVYPGKTSTGELKQRFEMVDAECTPVTVNPKGPVSAGRLVLKGYLTPLALQLEHRRDGSIHYTLSLPSNSRMELDLFLDYQITENAYGKRSSSRNLFCFWVATLDGNDMYLVLAFRDGNTAQYGREGIAQQRVGSAESGEAFIWREGAYEEVTIL